MEAELETVRREQKRYILAVGQAPEAADDLMKEIQRRAQRIRAIEAELAATRRPPIARRELEAKVERMARRKLATLRESLSRDRDGLRDVFRAFFAPGSLRFEPTTWLGRQVWKITGVAHVRPFTLESDPIGT
jgi:hypothetical protein